MKTIHFLLQPRPVRTPVCWLLTRGVCLGTQMIVTGRSWTEVILLITLQTYGTDYKNLTCQIMDRQLCPKSVITMLRPSGQGTNLSVPSYTHDRFFLGAEVQKGLICILKTALTFLYHLTVRFLKAILLCCVPFWMEKRTTLSRD